MPNTKGGKGYKSKKHTESKMPECNWDDGQQFGRILKPLGNRRFRVYCNDNKERICKLAGSIFKSQWCGEGTIVILSLRGLASGQGGGSGEDMGDIIDVVDHEWVSKLKKDERISQALFANLDTIKIADLKKKVEEGEELEEDDLFDKNDEEEEEKKEEQKEGEEKKSEDPEKKKARELAREKKNKERDQKRNADRGKKNMDEGEVDIDAI